MIEDTWSNVNRRKVLENVPAGGASVEQGDSHFKQLLHRQVNDRSDCHLHVPTFMLFAEIIYGSKMRMMTLQTMTTHTIGDKETV